MTFTVPVVDPDILDTVSLYADWKGTGTFDQIDQGQCTVNPDGSISFTHVYTEPDNDSVVIRLGDDGGQDSNYTVNVVVPGVTPTATLTTTSPYSWGSSPSGPTGYIMGWGDSLQFTNITPANSDRLEYHFWINGDETTTD